MVDVTCGGATKRLPLAVVEDDTATPLCGRNWVRALNLGSNNSLVKLRDFTPDVYSISRPNVKINANSDDITGLINEFTDVINNNLDKVKGYKATITLRDNAIPVVFRLRPVPFALRKAADQELDRLIKADIIEPVDPITTQINWATPCVYVPKSTGDSARLCGDFKVTINPYIVYTQHPLPRFEELMSTFNNFSEYSCIDLCDAYMQLEVDETSRQYLVISTHRGFFRYKRLCFGVCSAPQPFPISHGQNFIRLRRCSLLSRRHRHGRTHSSGTSG